MFSQHYVAAFLTHDLEAEACKAAMVADAGSRGNLGNVDLIFPVKDRCEALGYGGCHRRLCGWTPV